MKRYPTLALAAFVLVLVLAAPSALAVRMRIVDPLPIRSGQPPPGHDCTLGSNPGLNDYTPCSMYDTEQYAVTFVPCTQLLNPQTAGYNWCLWMNNRTNGSINTFSFEVSIPEGEGDQDLECSGSEGMSVVTGCPQHLADSGTFALSFFSDPALVNDHDFFLMTDFVGQPGPAGATISVSVREPGELGLFGLGLLAIGVGYGWQKRRQEPWSNDAV